MSRTMVLRDKAKQIKASDDLPTGEHFAIVIFFQTSVHVPGDERSRTHPGHGYPEHDVTVNGCEYWVVDDREQLQAALEAIEENNKVGWKEKIRYRVIQSKPVKVSTKVEVEVAQAP
jgi:hypothetical protein